MKLKVSLLALTNSITGSSLSALIWSMGESSLTICSLHRFFDCQLVISQYLLDCQSKQTTLNVMHKLTLYQIQSVQIGVDKSILAAQPGSRAQQLNFEDYYLWWHKVMISVQWFGESSNTCHRI